MSPTSYRTAPPRVADDKSSTPHRLVRSCDARLHGDRLARLGRDRLARPGWRERGVGGRRRRRDVPPGAGRPGRARGAVRQPPGRWLGRARGAAGGAAAQGRGAARRARPAQPLDERVAHPAHGLDEGDWARRRRAAVPAPVTPARVAAIDIGTNSTRLLVADVADGRLEREVERLLEITRLGDRVDADGHLNDASMERVHATLDRYTARARELGAARPLAVATSAVRDAANGTDFAGAVERRHGVDVRVLSGDQEARMTFRGVTSARAAQPGTLVCDIGGGSTELVLGDADGVRKAVSLELGCVRMS